MHIVRLVACAVVMAAVGLSWADNEVPGDLSLRKQIAFKADGYAGTETLTNFPVLVRLSESAIKYFYYSDFKQPNGGDLWFSLSDGTVLSHEIQVWDEEGESLVWVRIPELTAETEFIAHYGFAPATENSPTQTWSENFLGVWHFDKLVDGATPDATGNGLTMTNRYPTSTKIALPDGGKLAGAIDNGVAKGFHAPCFTNIFSKNVFSVSGWFKIPSGGCGGNARFFSSKTAYNKSTGFEFDTSNSGSTSLCVTTAGGNRYYPPCVLKDENGKFIQDWMKFTLSFDGTRFCFYQNGVSTYAKSGIAAITQSSDGFSIGNNAIFNDGSFQGRIDEVRFAMFSESADWAKAEYDTETSEAFLSHSVASKFVSDFSISKPGNDFVVTVNALATDCGVKIYAIFGPTYPYACTNYLGEVGSEGGVVSGVLHDGPDCNCTYGILCVSKDGTNVAEETLGGERFLNGVIKIAAERSAVEGTLGASARFLLSRPASASDQDLVVRYTVDGTAVAGKHYEPLSGEVTIPLGAASVAIDVSVPYLRNRDDHTVTVTLNDSNFKTEPDTKSATVTIVSPCLRKKIVFKPSGYAGTETLTNFPVLVRFSEAGISDFHYSDFKQPNGGDLWFSLPNGTVLPHEIQVWDEEGESLVWVRVPELTAETEFRAYYGSDTTNVGDAGKTWSENYLGVWHLDEVTAGATPDATGHGLTMTNAAPTATAMDSLGGRIGGAIANNSTVKGYTTGPYTDLFKSSKFTVSGWFIRRDGNKFRNEERYMATKTGASTVGFDFRGGNSSTTMNYRFDGWNNAVVGAPSVGAEWVKMSLSLNTSLNVYTNGVLVGTYTKNTLTHQYGFAIGNNAALNSWEFSGSIDEVRFAMFDESADWVKAEYDTETSPTFLTNTGARQARPGLTVVYR